METDYKNLPKGGKDKKKLRLFLRTYGCQMNEYDSSRLRDLLVHQLGAEPVTTPEIADIVILNTCSVREKAQEKVFSELGRLKKLKEHNPNMILGVGGCVASQEKDNILKRAPFVDFVFGPQTIHRVPQLIAEVTQKAKPAIDTTLAGTEKFDYFPEPHVEGKSAYVSIMEGCSKKCAYCVVPFTRGEEISRPLASVLSEINALAQKGVCEIILLGQNVNDYRGKIKDSSDHATLASLLNKIAAINAIKRIRFLTSHPRSFSDELINAFAFIPKLVNHLHLPVQSGSNRILRLMGRGYTTEFFEEQIAKLRKIRPLLSVSTDFIVGFPDETEEDFAATIELAKRIGFDHSFSYMYSKRPFTRLANSEDSIPITIKKERLYRLQKILLESEQKISQSLIGTVQTVLITENSSENKKQYSGRTENNRIVHWEADFLPTEPFANIKITAAMPNSLYGIPILITN